ncbi:glycerol-3-phosphate 1-O-acyltransferase PlsY [uncultured Granulicatella sp.]|uniref:glycerol-3-phosphate 1-O-acyltransferase PlsY n=1 Tax=uncultured Granulicatella sp. TaxID=316089 RepID=UPI0026120C99|nr:glycerol-3-phosphate 1-O-acyltransferase PlsY [uncultured Granulicatella sp.]
MSFTFIIGAIVAYLLGSIPSGLWVGQYFFKKDIRHFGSGNLGSTNAFRVLGKKAGSLVLFCDIFKGFLAMILALTVFKQPDISPLWIASFAVIGHTFPIFASFKGGKAVATFAGMILAYQPLLLLYGLIIFLGLLAITRMVSLTAMVTITLGVFLSLLFNDWTLTLFALAIDIFIIYRHRSNIQRILNGTENKVPMPWKQKNKDTK